VHFQNRILLALFDILQKPLGQLIALPEFLQGGSSGIQSQTSDPASARLVISVCIADMFLVGDIFLVIFVSFCIDMGASNFMVVSDVREAEGGFE